MVSWGWGVVSQARPFQHSTGRFPCCGTKRVWLARLGKGGVLLNETLQVSILNLTYFMSVCTSPGTRKKWHLGCVIFFFCLIWCNIILKLPSWRGFVAMDMGLLLPPHVLTVVPPPQGELPSVFPPLRTLCWLQSWNCFSTIQWCFHVTHRRREDIWLVT